MEKENKTVARKWMMGFLRKFRHPRHSKYSLINRARKIITDRIRLRQFVLCRVVVFA